MFLAVLIFSLSGVSQATNSSGIPRFNLLERAEVSDVEMKRIEGLAEPQERIARLSKRLAQLQNEIENLLVAKSPSTKSSSVSSYQAAKPTVSLDREIKWSDLDEAELKQIDPDYLQHFSTFFRNLRLYGSHFRFSFAVSQDLHELFRYQATLMENILRSREELAEGIRRLRLKQFDADGLLHSSKSRARLDLQDALPLRLNRRIAYIVGRISAENSILSAAVEVRTELSATQKFPERSFVFRSINENPIRAIDEALRSLSFILQNNSWLFEAEKQGLIASTELKMAFRTNDEASKVDPERMKDLFRVVERRLLTLREAFTVISKVHEEYFSSKGATNPPSSAVPSSNSSASAASFGLAGISPFESPFFLDENPSPIRILEFFSKEISLRISEKREWTVNDEKTVQGLAQYLLDSVKFATPIEIQFIQLETLQGITPSQRTAYAKEVMKRFNETFIPELSFYLGLLSAGEK